LPHGSFQAWIKGHCEFEYSTAARYMKAAKQISTGVEISKLSDVFTPSKSSPKQSKTSTRISTAVDISESDADWLRQHLATPHPIPLTPGNVVFGLQPSGDVAMVFYESMRDRGFWYDWNVTEGTYSTRPCRPEMLSNVFGNAAALQGLTWEAYPHDGQETFLRDVLGCE
jgi:hypothetical protein